MSFLDSGDDPSPGSALARLLAGLRPAADPDPLAQLQQYIAGRLQFPADGGGLFGSGYAQHVAQDMAARLSGPAVGSELRRLRATLGRRIRPRPR